MDMEDASLPLRGREEVAKDASPLEEIQAEFSNSAKSLPSCHATAQYADSRGRKVARPAPHRHSDRQFQ